MKLAIIGSRGIPANYGGFETFAEELSVNLVKEFKYSVTVVGDCNQKITNSYSTNYEGVNLLYSKYSKSDNPFLFYYDSIKLVSKSNNIIYSCGPAGGIYGWIARRNNAIMITNPDGLNWQRPKWNYFIKRGFQILDFLSTKFSHYIACDSFEIEKYYNNVYKSKKTFVVEYGAYTNPYNEVNNSYTNSILKKYNLIEHSYHLIVSRLEPENHVNEIINGFLKQERKYPLVVVGNLDDTKYVKTITKKTSANIKFLDGIYNKKELAVIRSKAFSYWHGHSVGGTNPSLLEAMASKNLCVCHDNVFNRETIGNFGVFFNDCHDINNKFILIENDQTNNSIMKKGAYQKIVSYYSWGNITKKYAAEFNKAF